MSVPVIVGFNSGDKVPGFFGETKTGQGGASTQTAPLLLLVCGIQGPSATALPYTPYPLTANADCDTLFQAGYQAARMGYSALKNPGAIVYGMGIPAATGAVAATAIINLGGTYSTSGTLSYRINGETRSITVGATDTLAQVGTNLVNDINSVARWPVTAASAQLGTTATYQVTVTHKTGGKGGNQQLLALDASQVPSGMQASVLASWLGTVPALTWQATTTYPIGAMTQPTISNGYFYRVTAITTGSSGASQPTWPTTVGTTVVDTGVTWTCVGAILTGNIIPFTGGTGVETVTAALAAIINSQFDRIAPAQNDSTSAPLWLAQVDAQAGPTTNILGQLVFATNGTEAAAQTLSQVSLNDVRAMVLNQVNGETHPCEVAASFAAQRESQEGANPNAGYDGSPVLGAAPNAWAVDVPNHAAQLLAQ